MREGGGEEFQMNSWDSSSCLSLSLPAYPLNPTRLLLYQPPHPHPVHDLPNATAAVTVKAVVVTADATSGLDSNQLDCLLGYLEMTTTEGCICSDHFGPDGA